MSNSQPNSERIERSSDSTSELHELDGTVNQTDSVRKSFVELHWEGPRFQHVQFPVAVAKELAVFETAIKGLAREMWLEKHNKKRVSPGFADRFNLFLNELKDGCVNTVLVAGTADTEEPPALFEVEDQKIFDDALDLFLRVLNGAATIEETSRFHSLNDALTFGKALNPGDEVKVVDPRDPGRKSVTYSARKRATIRSKYGAQDEEDTRTLCGWVSMVDEKGEITFTTFSGDRIGISEGNDPALWERCHSWLSRTRTSRLLLVDGTFLIANNGRIKKAIALDSVEEAYPSEWHDRIVELMSLKDGWLGRDEGPAIAIKAKRILDSLLLKFYEEDYFPEQRPGIYPLIRGGFQLEWESSSISWSVEITNDGDIELSAFGEDIDHDEDINNEPDPESAARITFEKLKNMKLIAEGRNDG